MPAEVMASSSSNDALRPTVNQPPRRSYLPVRTRQVKLIPTAEALKLLSGTRVGHHRKVIRKLSAAEAQTWDLTAFCTSNAQNEHSGTVVSSANVTSHPVGANHTGSEDTHLQTLNPNILRNLCGGPVEPDQNAGVGVSKTKDKGKAVANRRKRKRKLASEDGQSSGKRGCGVAKGYKR